jgi:hypothetical protein
MYTVDGIAAALPASVVANVTVALFASGES